MPRGHEAGGGGAPRRNDDDERKGDKFKTPYNLSSFCDYLITAIEDEDKAGKEYHKVKLAIPGFLEEDFEQMGSLLDDVFHSLALDENHHEETLMNVYKEVCYANLLDREEMLAWEAVEIAEDQELKALEKAREEAISHQRWNWFAEGNR